MKKLYCITIMCLFMSITCFAQDEKNTRYENKKLDFEFIEKDLKYILSELEKNTGIKFRIEKGVDLNRRGSFTVKNISVGNFLKVLSDYYDVQMEMKDDFLVVKKSKKTFYRNIFLFIILIFLIILFFSYIKVKSKLKALDDVSVARFIEKADESKLLNIIKGKNYPFVFKVLSLNKLFELKSQKSRIAIYEALHNNDILFKKIVFEKIKENYNLGELNNKKYEDLKKEDFLKIKNVLIINR